MSYLEGSTSRRRERLYTFLMAGNAIFIVLLAAAIVLFSPRSDRMQNAAGLLVGGLLLTLAIFKPGLRRGFLLLAVLSAIALVEAARTPGGLGNVLILPMLGLLGVVPLVRGWRLLALFSFVLGVIFVGLAITFSVGSMARFSDENYAPTTVLYFTELVALALLTLWWIGGQLRDAMRATELARVKAEESERRYRQLFEEAGDGMFVMDLDWRILDANASFCELLGYSRDELMTRRYGDLLDERERGLALASFRSRQMGEQALAERALVARDGSRKLVEILLRPMSEDRVHVSVRDLSARRKAEEDLARTARLLEAIVETSPVAIVAGRPDGRALIWNKAAQSLLGLTREETDGRRNPDSIVEEDRGLWRVRMQRAMAGESLAGERLRVLAADGSDRDVDVYMAPLYETGDTPSGVVAVLVDVTERVAMESQLRQAAKMEAIGQLAGGVAHDFNNIITAIRGYAELLRAGAEDRPQDREDLGEIIVAADRASALTNQLLAFARRTVPRPRVLDPGQIIVEMEPMLRPLLGDKILLERRARPGLGSILMDLAQLEQVVLNLAVNARDAMPDGGRLTIDASVTDMGEDDEEGVRREHAGHFYRLTIADTGVGMSETVQKHLFEPFFTTKEPGKGTGLGLATVFGILKMAGAWIDVQSTPGSGTTFELYFPIASGDGSASRQHGEQDALPSGQGTVLFVEDDRAVRSFGRRCLEDLGYRVLEAANADEALAIAQEHADPIDLLLTDVVMPGIQGPELARRIAQIRPMAVVFTSGYLRTDSHSDAVENGAYLEKPYDRAGLARAVRRALGREFMETDELEGQAAE